jgi:hypothetical protein
VSKTMNNPRYWRRRASEVRIRAGAEPDLGLKRKLLNLAKNYEDIADQAEERVRAARSRPQGDGGGYSR